MRPEVVGIGEVLIDFVATEPVSYIEVPAFQKCFGGAPMNTLVGIARLGSSSGAITAVGEDPFGQFLIQELKRNNVDTSQVKIKKGTLTTLAFVANEPKTGERSFIFYRKPWVSGTSDSALSIDDIDIEYIKGAEILHVSGFALSQNPSRKAIIYAVKQAKKEGVKVSFDPTLRLDVWSSEHAIRKFYSLMLRLSDIATFSREEYSFLFGTANPKKAAEKCLRRGVKIVGIKLGVNGAFIMTKEGQIINVPAFKVKAVDTTGAGDGWNAGFLVGILNKWDLKTCVTVANAVGALVVTKRGAITALPHRNELNDFLSQQNMELRV
ncbi:MAG: sugar kinase [Candidatus Bathyarchaeia archaeon]